MGITSDINIGRIKIKFDILGGDRSGITDVLDQIGALLAKEAKIAARNQGIVMTSRLINSIKHKISHSNNKVTVRVAPVKTPYAIYQEFGAPRTEASRRAMFGELRRRGRLGIPGKSGFSETHHMARHFMRPAFQAHAFKTIPLLRMLLRE